MALRISGKNLDIGEALRDSAEARLDDAVRKYFDGGYTGTVTFEREGSGFKADCSIHLDTGVVLNAGGEAQDPHQSFDLAATRMEKRLRRYKRRLKEHHHLRRDTDTPAAAYVIASPDEDVEIAQDYNPTVIAEETTHLSLMTVGEAVMAMDMRDLPVIVFRHAGHGGINVVYRRTDGHIGWIDPQLAAERSATH